MAIDADNPLLDSRWVRDVGNAIHEHLVGNDRRDIDRLADQRHRELVTVHREGWAGIAKAIDGGLRAIADAIRNSSR